MRCYILISLVVIVLADTDIGLGKNVIFTMAPGESTCFVKTLVGKKVIVFDYQVINSSGDFSISFEVLAPHSCRCKVHKRRSCRTCRRLGNCSKHGRSCNGLRVAVPARLWPTGAYELNVTEPGAYQFCFDNSFDSVNFKTILFNIKIRSRKRYFFYKLDQASKEHQTDDRKIPENSDYRTVLDQFGVPGILGYPDQEVTPVSYEFLGRGTNKPHSTDYRQRSKRGRLLKARRRAKMPKRSIERFRPLPDDFILELLDYMVH